MNARPALLATALVVALSSSPAHARCPQIDCKQYSTTTVDPIEPPDFSDLAAFSRIGQIFTYTPGDLYSVSGGGVVAYSSPFSFNVGNGASNTLYVKEDGIVGFGRSLAGGGFTPVASLTDLGVPLIAPFYADLNQNARSAAPYNGVVIQQGLADPFADASGAYSLAEAKTAIQITWYGFGETTAAGAPGTAPVYTQLLLIDEGGGDFDFRLRAGAPGSSGANSPGGGIGGFVFAQDSYQYATPYDGTFAGGFSVRGGQIAALAGAVPEPEIWVSMIAGLGMAGAGLRRRKAGALRRATPA